MVGVGGVRLRTAPSINEQRWWAGTFCFAVIVVSILPAVAARPRPNYDSILYLAPPSLDSGRLPFVPLVYWLLGDDLRAITVFQAVLGAACWSALLWEVSHVAPRAVRFVAMVGIACIACSTYVVIWYAAILSESISISLLALLFAGLARWQRTGASLWAVAVVASLSAWSRSTSAYILLFVGLIAVCYSAVRARHSLMKALGVAGVALLASVLSGEGQLWQQPFLHSMGERILPSPAFTAWFAARGMPVSDALRRLAGPDTLANSAAFNHSPALAAFRNWMTHSGRADYPEFLASHPLWVVKGTFGRHEELGPQVIAIYGGGVSRPWVPALVRNVLLSHRQDTLILLGLVDLVVLAKTALRRACGRATALWLGMICVGLLTLVVDWGGDAWEVGRHSVEGTIATALAGLMLMANISSRVPPAERRARRAPTSRVVEAFPVVNGRGRKGDATVGIHGWANVLLSAKERAWILCGRRWLLTITEGLRLRWVPDAKPGPPKIT